jgi:flavorubredoxin
LEQHYHEEVDADMFKQIKATNNGDTLDVGSGKVFTFVPIPMIHWPDSMVSFMTDDNGKNVLFSNDAFGQHIAVSRRWDDENGLSEIMWEAEKYYANILLHLSNLIAKALKAVGSLPIEVICPSHGVCWRTNVGEIVKAYTKWSSGDIEENSVVIVYDTMWESTARIAKALHQEIEHRGIPVKRFNLTSSDYSDVITEVMKARAVLVGSPTLNRGLFPSVAQYLIYQKGLRPMNKVGFAFGSFGWSKGAVAAIITELNATGIDLVDESIEIQFVPRKGDLDFKGIIDKLIEKMG